MASANELVAKAASQIGVKEVPAGSNKVKYNTAYYGREVSGSAYPWCCAFVWWLFNEIGANNLFYDGKKTAYCPTVVNWAKAKGIWLDRSAKPQAGDLILFGNSSRACHIGVVEKRIDASYVQTIEGNTSVTSNDNGGAVMRRTRSYGSVGSSWYIMGFVRPNWSGATQATTTTTTTTTTTGGDEVYGFALVKNGSKGDAVKVCQAALNVRNGAGLQVDGDSGSKTVAAIKKWQTSHGLEVDGQCGPKTWQSLLGK